MPYLILLVLVTLILAAAIHFRGQYRQTAQIRLNLQEARSNKTLTGMHSLRRTD